ncbi:MAG: type III-A CRISPR-associated RAMP protein Csm4 [Balneolaceae bacterium]|nr:type III-A CRISPR-associated RAMP protein Csm4 [Balneolaceae bacterium]
MNTRIFYLKPEAPFHLQTGGGDHETVDLYPRSDTLSAAISYWWFRQYDELPGFPDSIPFRLSSLFPSVNVNGTIQRLYPKPAGLSINPDKHHHKVFKKIRWLDEELFELWQSGESLDAFWPADSEDNRLKRGGSVLVKDSKADMGIGPLLITDARTRVVLDRVNSASTPFHFVRVFHARDVRLWFYADLVEEHETTFTALLRLLGDEGIGADRTIGMGRFIVENAENSTPPQGGGKLFNLGIYNPLEIETDDIDWGKSAYNLEKRSGWVSGKSLRRRPVPCIGENAVLKSDSELKGNVPCVVDKDDDNIPESNKPDYSVYRDCRGYFIPTQIQ